MNLSFFKSYVPRLAQVVQEFIQIPSQRQKAKVAGATWIFWDALMML
jgi:hypothetical protein